MPTTTPDSVITQVNTAVVIDPLANDEGEGLVLESFTQPAHGHLVRNPDHTLTYTPAADFAGLDSFTYRVRDANGATATGTVTISVLAANTPPVAVDDMASVTTGSAVDIPVLANDQGAEGDPLSLTAIGTPGYGTASFIPPDRIRYRPQPGFVGIDRFTYTIEDSQGGIATGSVTVQVSRANQPPMVRELDVETQEATPLVLDLLREATDADGDALQLVALGVPQHGRLAVNPDRTVTYTPAAGYSGEDQFSWTVSDGRGGLATGIVRVRVVRPNRPPQAEDTALSTSQSTPLRIDPLSGASDPDGDPLRLSSFSLPRHGLLSLDDEGRLLYSPDPGFVGADQFSCTLVDGRGGLVTRTVRITVTASEPPASRFANGYARRRRILLPARQSASEILSGFVLLVHESGEWLKSVAHGGLVESEAGFDLRFELEDGSKLAHEIERYDPVAGQLVAWVRIPSWDLSAAKQLFLYYGKADLSQSEADPAATWQDYLAVWDCVSGQDRSGHGRHLTPSEILPGELVGPAGRFQGSSDLRLMDAAFLSGLAAFCLTAVVRAEASLVGSPRPARIIQQGNPTGSVGTAGLALLYTHPGPFGGAAETIQFALQTSGGSVLVEGPAYLQRSTPMVIGASWQSGQLPKLWIDGMAVSPSWVGISRSGQGEAGAVVRGTTAMAAAQPLSLGLGALNSERAWVGLIDEVRLRASVPPAAQFALEAANILTPWRVYAMGPEERPTMTDFPPVAVDCEAVTRAGQHVDVDVLAAAWDPEARPLAIAAVSTPARGSAAVIGSRVRYTPVAGFVGEDGFGFVVRDAAGNQSNEARARITVSAFGELPVPVRVIPVSNRTQLDAALRAARPGDHILLADGSYGTTRLEIRVSGTTQHPIVIRAQNVLGARLPGGFTYAPGISHVWLWGIDFKDAKDCVLRGSWNVIRRCRIWPKPSLTGPVNGLIPREGSYCRIDYCEIRMHTTAEVIAELGSAEFQRVQYGAIRAYYRQPSDILTHLIIERCLLSGGLSGVPYANPNSQFVECDGVTQTFKDISVNWVMALCYGNVARERTIVDMKIPGMHMRECHIECPASGRLQMRNGQDQIIERTRFSGQLDIVGGPKKRVINSNIRDIRVIAGDVPWTDYSAHRSHRQAIDARIINCSSNNLYIGYQYDSRYIYPALDTIVERHSGPIRYGLHRGTIVRASITEPGVTPAEPATLSAREVGPLAPWVGTRY